MDLGVMVMKRYSILSRSPELEPHHKTLLNFTPKNYLFTCLNCKTLTF